MEMWLTSTIMGMRWELGFISEAIVTDSKEPPSRELTRKDYILVEPGLDGSGNFRLHSPKSSFHFSQDRAVHSGFTVRSTKRWNLF
ncbi:MAG: hypothetical protein ACI8X5_000565 [Planctomycetota bacterium]|jgi:hypothetical protein